MMEGEDEAKSYYLWKKAVLKRDGYKCVLCGSTTQLECDHIKSAKAHPELFFLISNGRTLCKPCHKKTDTYGGKQLKGRRVDRDYDYGPS